MSTNAPAEVKALKQAQTQILAAERRVAAIEPPADARKIHADLLALLRLEASLTGDLVLTTSYTPQLKQALAPTRPAGTALAKGTSRRQGLERPGGCVRHVPRGARAGRGKARQAEGAAGAGTDLRGERDALQRRVELSAAVEAALRKKDMKAANAAIRSLLAIGSDAVRTRNAEISPRRVQRADRQDLVLTAAVARERSVVKAIGRRPVGVEIRSRSSPSPRRC